MARVVGFEPAESGQNPEDVNGNPVPVGVWGDSNIGVGVFGTSGVLPAGADIPINTAGVEGHSIENPGVFGRSIQNAGVQGEGIEGTGVVGRSTSASGILGITFAPTPTSHGVFGVSTAGGNGVVGLVGNPTATGVIGNNPNGTGVRGSSGSGEGVHGDSLSGAGVTGLSQTSFGVFAQSDQSGGVLGITGNPQASFAGVAGVSLADSIGVAGNSGVGAGVGVRGVGGRGVVGIASGNGPPDGPPVGVTGLADGDNGLAGLFRGNVVVTGFVISGLSGFEIDHPLDPANRYLRHSAVESPDMLNVYSGNVTTDASGEASVTLPDYFTSLNQDFRYQLTVIGQFAQAIVAQEIRDNQFTIKTEQPQIKVSWQVTGVRQDPWAVANRIAVDEEKAAEDRGRYVHPKLQGQPEEARLYASPQLSELPGLREPPAAERLEELPRMTDRAHLETEWRQLEELAQQMRQSSRWLQKGETNE